MPAISIIKLRELKRFKRIDAEYYQPQYLRYNEKIESMNHFRLGDRDYARVTDGIHEAVTYSTDSGIRCLSAQSIKRGYLNLSANMMISKEDHSRNLKTSLKEGDVLLSSEGTIGDSAIVTGNILPANAVRQVGIIRVTSKTDPFFLCAFLNSKYGRFQSKRETTGNVQGHLFIDKMTEILIPILPQQDKIARMMRQGTNLLIESEKMFKVAQETLVKLLGLEEYATRCDLVYLRSYRDTLSSHRLDAEYYQPKYVEALNKIKGFSNGYCQLTEKAPLSSGKIDFARDLGKEFKYVELANINESFGTIDEYTTITSSSAPSRARMLLKKGDVIASAVEGSFDKVALVSERFDNAIGSTGFFVFRPKSDILGGYLLALVKSPIVQLQLQRESSGTVLTSVPKRSANKIIVPDLPKDKQKPIDDIVLESHKLREQARILIDEAIKTVETLIEGIQSTHHPTVNMEK